MLLQCIDGRRLERVRKRTKLCPDFNRLGCLYDLAAITANVVKAKESHNDAVLNDQSPVLLVAMS